MIFKLLALVERHSKLGSHSIVASPFYSSKWVLSKDEQIRR